MPKNRTILFNPVSIVHDRQIDTLARFLPDWEIRRVYNLRFPWFRGRGRDKGVFYFAKGYSQKIPGDLFDNVGVLALFTAQPRIPTCNLVQEATIRSIPIVAIEEVYQMMLEQGLINNYLLPVDRFFVASDYERDRFRQAGVPEDIMEVAGCVFGPDGQWMPDPSRKAAFKEELGLSLDKLTATLSLSFLSPDGETLGIREELLRHVSSRMPGKYELAIKPHPAEDDNNFRKFAARYAPGAKIIEPRTPINKVLDITDILINRGNSQVIIDALRRNIPVAVFPLGRKTFFHGILDEVIIEGSNDIASVLGVIDAKGMGLYKNIFEKYLSISPEQAVRRIAERIAQIADKGEFHKPQERLIELAIFWGWMGYHHKGIKTLTGSKDLRDDGDLAGKVYRLLRFKTGKEDLPALKCWAGQGYREWVLQSLWIKRLYLKGERLNSEDKEWLAGYPPRMERLRFLDYAICLYWCYINSAMYKEAEGLGQNLCKEFRSVKIIRQLRYLDLAQRENAFFNTRYLIARLQHRGGAIFKSHILERLFFKS